jgi:tetratricopeptide (TPR) repeat protein
MKLILLLALLSASIVHAQTLEKAKTLYEEKKYDASQKLLLSIKEGHEDFAAARYQLGRIAFDKQAYEEAEGYFEEAVETNDKVADYHYWYGSALGNIAQNANMVKQGMLAPKIKDAFEKTVALDPKNLEAHWGLIEFYSQAPGFMGGSWEKAEETAKAIMKIKKAEGLRALGVVFERQEKFSDAEKQFVLAYREDPLYQFNLSNFYVRQKKFDQAFALFEDSMKKNPQDMIATYQIGRLSAVSGQKLDLGESCLLKYLGYQPGKNEPSHAGANMRLAQIREKRGKKTEAKKLYETALKLDPSLKEAKEGLERVK